MRMGQGVRTGLGHGGITCVLQTQFSIFFFFCDGGWIQNVQGGGRVRIQGKERGGRQGSQSDNSHM